MAGLLDEPYIGYPQLARRRAVPNTDFETSKGLLRGISYYPYDLLGAPIDLINMALTPLGMGSKTPVMGSDYLQGLAQRAGLSLPKTDSSSENIGRILSSIINPAAGARAVGKVIDPAMQAAAPVGRAVGEQAYLRTEGLLQNQGLMPSIVPRDVVNEMGMATTLPKDSIFVEAVKNTPSAQITDEGLLINIMRKQKPEQAMTESVRSGVFYLPEGSTNIKHYGGTNPYGGYGGTEKISGETLYKNPLFVKGATGGKAPETAYAQLTSKEDLKILQDDVFNAITGPKDIKYDLVEQFLEKHAPDLASYSSYIYDNSRKGNQLKYALQEAAVAQKVRDAGYDSVIGHSKGKAGPFISEIFDVRESYYPNATGGFELNPKFEEMYQNSPVIKK